MTKDEIELELMNWAYWKVGAGWHEVTLATDTEARVSGTFDDHRPRYAEAKVPIRSGAAKDVDDIVTTLQVGPRGALWSHYLRIAPDHHGCSLMTQEQIAVVSACSLATYQRRLAEGRQSVGDGLDSLRRRSRDERVRSESTAYHGRTGRT